ncbi:MAG: endopeptidase La [Spirochaetota bacterium]
MPVLPLRNTVIFPFSITPIVVGIPRSVKLIEDALQGDSLIGLLAMKDPTIEEPQPEQIYATGTVAKILRVLRTPDNTMQVVVQGLERFRVSTWLAPQPYLRVHARLTPDETQSNIEIDALVRSLRDLAQEVISLSPNVPKEAGTFLNLIQDPRYLVYLVAANIQIGVNESQQILETNDIKEKLRILIENLVHEKAILSLGKKIRTDTKEEIDKAQRDYYLRQQLKAIRKELGELDENQSVITEYTEKLEKKGLSEEAKNEVQKELKRLASMPPQAAEYPMITTYLDWILGLPWDSESQDQLDVAHARSVLDEDHYDLQEVKDRVLEYLAVRKLVTERSIGKEGTKESEVSKAMGAILCFVGPPGVGKTSLGQSIARALGRKFTRMSLGGMRDEAEIRGHRRTYIGAMPGRIIQSISRAGTRNPVFMLDEVDKIGNDWRGDPSSALLEVLDPAQNHAFRDHYLNVDFDLSRVIFITTANQLETIPPPLHDRMEVIRLDGYTEYEKVRISQNYLIPRQITANGLQNGEISFAEEAVRKIIQDYTREAGVRDLERRIGAICRKSAVKVAEGIIEHIEITSETVREYLKKEKFESENSETFTIPGIATGLAVTSFGGDILFIEATRMKGKGSFKLTGQLGDVMRESAQIAYSYVRSKTGVLGIAPKMFMQSDVHLHVPAGAVPKDGPSAGIAMVMSIASLFSRLSVRSDTAMTGEVTLRGRVLPVGGIKMKLLAAHRAGLKQVILPKRNEGDLDELPEEVRNDLKVILVGTIDEAFDAALVNSLNAVAVSP